jgi:hypothetical protein
VYIRSLNSEVRTMVSGRRDLLHKFETLDRNEVWKQMATLAINAAVIVVIAFVIAIICVGAS